MAIKQIFISFILIIGATQISQAQMWVYNSSGTDTRGAYRYASLSSGADDNLRAASIYVNYYNLDQKYNIYLYEVTELECSENTIQYYTDTQPTVQTFSTPSKSDGIETIAMTEIEDLSTFLQAVEGANLLTIRINNNCGTGRDISFNMDNAADAVAFMTSAKGSAKVQEQEQEQEQVQVQTQNQNSGSD